MYLTFQDDWVAFRIADLMNARPADVGQRLPAQRRDVAHSQAMLAEHAAHLDDRDAGAASSTTTCAELYGISV